MAENQASKASTLCGQVLTDLKKLVWGPELKAEVVQRWSQGTSLHSYFTVNT